MSPLAVVIVPCFNEAARLDRDAFVAFVRSHPGVRLLFVNDGSRDETLRVLEQIAGAAPDRIAVMDLPTNAGKAEAVRQGMLRALDSELDLVGFWDADLATPLTELPAFVELLEERAGVEMVFGSRVRLLGRTIDRNPLRHYIGRVFATAASLVLRLPIYDTQCGAKLFRASPQLRQVLARPFHSRWIFDVEIIARFGSLPPPYDPHPLQRMIYEHPLPEWRDAPASKRRAMDLARSAIDLGVVYWKYIRPGGAS